MVAKYTGRPAVIASSVITAELADIGKKLPPPMTPAEEAFDKTMKSVSGANTALRKGIEESSVELTKQQAAILKKGFMEAQMFFKDRKTTDAVGWSQDAYKFVDTIDQAVAAGKWEEVKTAATSLAGMCTQCHTVHRERYRRRDVQSTKQSIDRLVRALGVLAGVATIPASRSVRRAV